MESIHVNLSMIINLLFRSTQVIFQDAEHALVTVSLFQKDVDTFKHKVNRVQTVSLHVLIVLTFQARENRFIVRDFVYNPDELQAGKNELSKLVTDKKKQFGPLVSVLSLSDGLIRLSLSLLSFRFDGSKPTSVNVSQPGFTLRYKNREGLRSDLNNTNES